MTPNTTVTLYATDFDITNKHVVFATSEGDALAAVSSFPSRSFPNCYWQREGRAFRAPGNINDIEKYNYCVFDNNGHKNFAFITSFEYHNDAYTDVSIQIDPWLNFAGKYTFHPSPVVRQHPESDPSEPTYNLPEPIQPGRQIVGSYNSYGQAANDDDLIHVITKYNVLQSPGTTTGFWQAVGNTFTGNGAGLSEYYGNVIVNPCNCEVCVQPNTMIIGTAIIQSFMKKINDVNAGDVIIDAYHIPLAFRTTGGEQGLFFNDLPVKNGDNMTLFMPASVQSAKWNKTKYSGQYNFIQASVFGETRDYDISLFKDIFVVTFAWYSFQHSQGNVVLVPRQYAVQSNQYEVTYGIQSPVWDRVQLSVTSARTYHALSGVADTVMGVLAGNIPSWGDLAGVAESLGGNRSVQSSVRGSNSTSVSTANYAGIPIELKWFCPSDSDIERIDAYFSTYGYSMGGEIQPLNTHNMPFWNYVETRNAVITGTEVPQWAINNVIKMFDSGVFIYSDIGSYKKTENVAENHL